MILLSCMLCITRWCHKAYICLLLSGNEISDSLLFSVEFTFELKLFVKHVLDLYSGDS